jgi:hypothetical protein
MPAGKYNFTIEQGAKFSRDFVWKNADKTPVNISGYSFRMMARHKHDDVEPIISLSTVEPPGGISILDGANGRLRIGLTQAQTTALNFTEAIYDLEATPPADEAIRLLEGTITLSREVTK